MKIDETIFKAYDIRGRYPEQLDENIARLIGAGLVDCLRCEEIWVGRDMRTSGESIFCALVDGITSAGANVVDIGLVSTDGLYFAVGKFGAQAGVMITASHNPPSYNGFKICRERAVPLSGTDGLPQIKEFVKKGELPKNKPKGSLRKFDIDSAYTEHCLSFIDVEKIKPFRIAIDAGNGMAGKTLPPIFEKLPIEVERIFFELDGTFPNHLASPIEPENTEELRKRVAGKLDLGSAFDGDADRMFLIDECGKIIGGDIVTAIVARSILEKHPGETIVYNLICSRAVRETIEKMGGKAVRSRVGHAIIKPLMKKHNAIFGGEHSGHFYFRENWFADSGLIAFLVCLELLSVSNKKLSELVAEIDHYYRSGEINSTVVDQKSVLKKIERFFSGKGFEIDELDGITISSNKWWANIRPSNTEPLLRLNVEADSPELLKNITDEILSLIRE